MNLTGHWTAGPDGRNPEYVDGLVKVVCQPSEAAELAKMLHIIREDCDPQPSSSARPLEQDEWGSRYEHIVFPNEIDSYTYDQVSMRTHPVTPMSMLAMRMKWGSYAENNFANRVPFDHVSIHHGKEKVYVFVVTQGRPVTLEDEVRLFPSDTLITQLIMLEPKDAT